MRLCIRKKVGLAGYILIIILPYFSMFAFGQGMHPGQRHCMYQLENNALLVEVSPAGAEMKRLYDKRQRVELLWPGKPEVWPRSSPVLFPIVGRLKNNQYTYQGKTYSMAQHGFARDMDFELVDEEPDRLSFVLESDYRTVENYPFLFKLTITYKLINECLVVQYKVYNPAREDLYFSLGAHPGFLCGKPQNDVDTKATIGLDMGKELLVYRLEKGLLQTTPSEGLLTSLDGHLELTDELIENDAMVFKKPIGRYVDLFTPLRQRHLRMTAQGWPYFGIWSKAGSDFVCLEPWYGIADSENTNGRLQDKEGIQHLKGGQSWSAEWSLELR